MYNKIPIIKQLENKIKKPFNSSKMACIATILRLIVCEKNNRFPLLKRYHP
jgi:maleate cis-trans isomerase